MRFLGDLLGYLIVVGFFFLPSAFVLSLIVSVLITVATRRRPRGSVTIRTYFLALWTIICITRLACLWVINVPQEGALQYVIGALVTPETVVETRSLMLQFVLRAMLVVLDGALWAYVLARLLQRKNSNPLRSGLKASVTEHPSSDVSA